MAEPLRDEPESLGASHREEVPGEAVLADAAVAGRSPHDLLEQARKRFKELATSCVKRCELKPEMARAVLQSLELGFAQTIKEDGRLMQRQFGRDVEAAVAWGAERLVEACRHLAADTPGQKMSPLQNLALLEVQALEIMLPELSQTNAVESVDVSVPATQLRRFCALLNDGLDFVRKAETAAGKRDSSAYRTNYRLSRVKLRDAARVLRPMIHGAGADLSDLTVGLRDFQLELAAHTGSLRMFLKALCPRSTAPKSLRHHLQVIDPHCLVGDLLPTLFDRHFAFTIATPRGIPAHRSYELVTAAHDTMWQQVGLPVSTRLAHPEKLPPAEFKRVVETELQLAIKLVNEQFASERVVISISSNKVREITRREW